jgi:hypothetical protein
VPKLHTLTQTHPQTREPTQARTHAHTHSGTHVHAHICTAGEVPSIEAVLPYLRTGGGRVCFYGFHAHHGMEDNPVHVYEFMARGVRERVSACVRQRVLH